MKNLSLILFVLIIMSFKAVSGEVICLDNKNCRNEHDLKNIFENKFLSVEHRESIAREIENFKIYPYIRLNNNGTLEIRSPQEIVAININTDSKVSFEWPQNIPLSEGRYFTEQRVEQTKIILKDFLSTQGFLEPEIKISKKKINVTNVSVEIAIKLGPSLVLDEIQINSESAYIHRLVDKVLQQYYKQRFVISEVRDSIDNLKQIFKKYGYYSLELESKILTTSESNRSLILNLTKTFQTSSLINGAKAISIKELKEELASEFLLKGKEIKSSVVKEKIKLIYKNRGFLDVKVNVTEKKTQSYTEDPLLVYIIEINEGKKTRIREVSFEGISVFPSEKIKQVFYEGGSEQIQSDVYDDDYFSKFPKLLENFYNQNGYLRAKVDQPRLKRVKGEKNFVDVSFRVNEYKQFRIKNIQFEGISPDVAENFLGNSFFTSDEIFNPFTYEEKLEKLIFDLNEQGYYFATLKGSPSSFLKFDLNTSEVTLKIHVDTGNQIRLNKLLFLGNKKTKEKVLIRELGLEQNSLIKKSQLELGRKKLLSLGLFKSIDLRVIPISNTNMADILINISEKESGAVELAPGIRTDLGAKFSASVSYDNIDGLAKKIAMKVTVNKRLNLSTLDERRREESSSLIEYDANLNYSEKYLFDTPIGLNTSIAKERKRFFSFDADIQTLSTTFSWEALEWLKFSTLYQLETISQFDATDEQEHGHFQIGSVTPGISFDFRNNRIFPTSGAFLNFTCEFANPSFASQSNDELEVNYYKLINRNRFYLPLAQKGVLALSTSFGIQENNGASDQENSYIPNIKVFRITGVDTVRGFSDREINRLVTNQDISKVVVNNRAYLASLKLEPRFFLSDSTILGIFYDAGRVFADEFDSSELRSSVGLSFKYLTPVGTLDFDYGIKLLRKKDESGNLESPGRLHVSIGFF